MRMVAIALSLFTSLPVMAAQLGVQVHLEKDSYLVYEALPVTVTIHNFSGRAVQLRDTDGKSWLAFVITDEANSLAQPTGDLAAGEGIVIPAGQSISQTIDLLPLFELRSRGNYKMQAVVTASGVSVASTPVRFTLINGRELWKRVVGLPAMDGQPDEYRTYSLLARRGEREDALYVGVQDEPHDTVYSLVALGPFFSTSDPQVVVDGSGQLHVLFQNGPRSYGYAHVDGSAKVVTSAAYSDFQSSPTLVVDSGQVLVRGGEQTFPKPAQVAPNDDFNPPPQPKPKSKRHWWWPFGSRS